MGKLVVLLDMGISKSGQITPTVLLLLLMALCVGNHGSEVNKFITQQQQQHKNKEVVGIPLASASASALKQTEGDGDGLDHGGGGGGSGGAIINGGKPAIESYGNVTVLAGQRGELKCRTFNLANYTVLWLRHRDTHLLSAGADAYTADSRFRAFQAPSTWGLKISSTRPIDGGVYECQISTTPPISAFTYLTVVEPVTHIEGLNGRGSELFIKAGSTINLTCIVEDATDNAPKHILWRHNNKVVNFEWARGGMSLVTEKKSRGVTVSRLLIQKAVRTDSGTYMCAPQNAHPAYVKIHVLEQGEKQAAMQSASSTSKKTYLLHIYLLLLQFVLVNTFDLYSILCPLSTLLCSQRRPPSSTSSISSSSKIKTTAYHQQPYTKKNAYSNENPFKLINPWRVLSHLAKVIATTASRRMKTTFESMGLITTNNYISAELIPSSPFSSSLTFLKILSPSSSNKDGSLSS